MAVRDGERRRHAGVHLATRVQIQGTIGNIWGDGDVDGSVQHATALTCSANARAFQG